MNESTAPDPVTQGPVTPDPVTQGSVTQKPLTICDGWVEQARRVPSPNFNERPQDAEINLLVVHNISLPPEQFGSAYIEQFFCNGLDSSRHPYFKTIADLQVSAHFLITRMGELIQFVSTDKRAWHAGQSSFQGQNNCNDFSIGVELEGADHIPYTPQQYNCLTVLSKYLLTAYPAIEKENIVGHQDIAPGRKTDPGPAFDWTSFRASLDI